MFSAQELFDLEELANDRFVENKRRYREVLQLVADNEFVKMKNEIVSKRDDILKELVDKCNTFHDPREICVKIYNYSVNELRIKFNKKIFRHDVMKKTDLLYRLTDNLFGLDNFKIWTLPSLEGDGKMDVMLGYFPRGVPKDKRQSDPTMPPLSPISVVESEDNECDDNARCYCQN